MVVLKLADWHLYQLLANSCYRALRKMRNYGGFFLRSPSLRSSQQPPLYPSVTKCGLEGRDSQTLACDFHGALLRPQSFFPYFMLVAFEGKGEYWRTMLAVGFFTTMIVIHRIKDLTLPNTFPLPAPAQTHSQNEVKGTD